MLQIIFFSFHNSLVDTILFIFIYAFLSPTLYYYLPLKTLYLDNFETFC